MRRISYLFTLLLLIVGAVSAYAQTPTATPIAVEEVPEGYYFIASTQSTIGNVANPYIAANGGAMKLVAQSDVTTDASTSQVGLWYIRKTGTDGSDNHSTFSIQSMEGSKFYWGVGGDCPLQTTIGIYRIGKDDSGYYFYGNGTANNITNTAYVNATSATAFGRNSSGSNNKWKLIPAGVKDITLNYTAGTNHFSVSKLVGTGKELSTSLDFYKDFEPATITPDDATSSYSVTCAYNFPFEFGKYYKMKIRWADRNDKNNEASDGVFTYRSVVWNGQVKGGISTRDVVTETNNALWSFQIVEGTANQVYLSNALGGQKVTIDNATTNNLKAYMGPVGTPFYVKKGNTGTNYTNGFRLQSLTNENANLNDISGGLGYWTDGGSREDAGSTFTIIGEAASCVDQEINTVVATNTANNEVITMNNLSITEKLTGKTGDKWLCNTFFTTNNGSYDSSTKTFTVSYTPTASAPYQLSSLEDNGVKHWQVIRTRNDANDIKNCYLKLNGENIQSRNNVIDRTSLSSIRTFTETNENYWAIVPAGNFNQFYLVNKADQTKKAYLANEDQGTAVTMSATNATGFYLNAQPTFSGITGGFTIQPNNSNKHAIGDHGNSNLCYWSNRSGDNELNDAGSIFYLVDLLADCKSVASATSSYVGGFSAQSISTLNATTACDGFFTKYDELLASTGNDVYTTPEENTLYRITFNRCNAVAAATNAVADAEGNVQKGSGDSPQERLLALIRNTVNTPSALVRFHQNGDNYTIEDVNSGYYYGFYYNDDRMFLVPATNQKGQFTIVNNFNGIPSYVGLKETSVSDDTKRFLWSCGSYESEVFDNHPYVRFHSGLKSGSTTEAEEGCVLRIQKVTTYPVSISPAGYASLCLPFSVTLPESGFTAYKVTAINRDNNNEMNLESVGRTIPAGEPVILQGAVGNYTLTINADNGTKATDNILTGATVKRTGISEDYYALAKKTIDETETVAFFRVSTTNMPANKAYLLKKNIPAQADNAAMFMFNFDGNGGEVTDINTATKAETESNVYYDLNGRRVLYPSHGIYVRGNGQKVFIK
uniref:hypothetical protein n=1 Tax=Alloprevotella sp. TaxID=1872471 RepID=UPI003FF0D7A6